MYRPVQHDGDTSLALSPDGHLLATGGDEYDNSIYLWELATGMEVGHFAAPQNAVASLAFMPDGWMLASGGGDSTILLWDILASAEGGGDAMSKTLDQQWAAQGEDGTAAYRALRALERSPQQTLPFLKKHLQRSGSAISREQLERWLRDLDSDSFEVRQQATPHLQKAGAAAAAMLEHALAGQPAPEVHRRLQALLDRLNHWTPEQLRTYRAIALMEHLGCPEARQILQTLATDPSPRIAREAQAALARLKKR